MPPSFIRGIEEFFPDVEITFDKFHLMKLGGEAVDETWIQEQKYEPELKRANEVHLAKKRRESQSRAKEILMSLKNSHLLTGCAYRLKLAMQDLLDSPAYSGWCISP